MDVLKQYHIDAWANREAHGVYVGSKKIASLGLRIRKGCSYHGFSLNVAMDLTPFSYINPCGYAGLQMTQMKDYLSPTPSLLNLGTVIARQINQRLMQKNALTP